MLIAAKYGDEKKRVPKLHQLETLCQGSYDTDMFIRMESHILNTLEWLIGHPTVHLFSKLMVAQEGYDQEVEHVAAYITDIALYHREFVSTKPSIVARSSLFLARNILGRPGVIDEEWSDMESTTIKALYHHLDTPSPTLRYKYSTLNLSGASQKMADFMDGQAAIRCQLAKSFSFPTWAATHSYNTPQKGDGIDMPGGYMTPDVTPETADQAKATRLLNC